MLVSRGLFFNIPYISSVIGFCLKAVCIVLCVFFLYSIYCRCGVLIWKHIRLLLQMQCYYFFSFFLNKCVVVVHKISHFSRWICVLLGHTTLDSWKTGRIGHKMHLTFKLLCCYFLFSCMLNTNIQIGLFFI